MSGMMRVIGKGLLLVACLGGMFACRPRNVLSTSQMIDLLVELHRGDGIMYVRGYDIGPADQEQGVFAVLLEKNGVTQAQFDSSLVWYTNHPQRMDKIYPHVIARLQEEMDRLKEQEDGDVNGRLREIRQVRPMRPLEEVMNEHLHGFRPLILRQTEEK